MQYMEKEMTILLKVCTTTYAQQLTKHIIPQELMKLAWRLQLSASFSAEQLFSLYDRRLPSEPW